MKPVTSFILCLLFYCTCCAQNGPSKEINKEYYQHKSKVKKIIGYSFLGSGVALFITGGIIDRVKKPELLAGFTYEFAGITSSLVSIPFFVSASKNKRKALSLTLGQQKIITLSQNTAKLFIQPATTLHIAL
jgi:hypothetical protein